jgi:hypothetical protein
MNSMKKVKFHVVFCVSSQDKLRRKRQLNESDTSEASSTTKRKFLSEEAILLIRFERNSLCFYFADVMAERLVFQKHQNRIDATSQKILCTTGLFFPTLLAGDVFLGGLTHLIIDEVYRRDRYISLFLGIIRSRLIQLPGLRRVPPTSLNFGNSYFIRFIFILYFCSYLFQ